MRTLVQKLRVGEQFLARGKVHGWSTAASMAVDDHSFVLLKCKIGGSAKALGFFWQKLGLERAAPVRRLVQKLRAAEQFLARGKVHGWSTAASMAVSDHSFVLLKCKIGSSAKALDFSGRYGRKGAFAKCS